MDDKNQPTATWQGPRFTLRWPGYFRPNAEDAQKIFTAVDTGLKASPKILTKRKAVEMIQRIADIDNIDAYLESLEEEQAEADAKAKEQQDAQMKALTEMAHGQGEGAADPTKPKPAFGKPPAKPGDVAGAQPAATEQPMPTPAGQKPPKKPKPKKSRLSY